MSMPFMCGAAPSSFTVPVILPSARGADLLAQDQRCRSRPALAPIVLLRILISIPHELSPYECEVHVIVRSLFDPTVAPPGHSDHRLQSKLLRNFFFLARSGACRVRR